MLNRGEKEEDMCLIICLGTGNVQVFFTTNLISKHYFCTDLVLNVYLVTAKADDLEPFKYQPDPKHWELEQTWGENLEHHSAATGPLDAMDKGRQLIFHGYGIS